MSNTPERSDPLVAGRLRLWQYISDGCILFASVVIALIAGKGWAWGPFILGPAVIAAAALCNEVTFRVGIAVLQPNKGQLQRARTRRRNRNVVIVPAYVTFAVASGVIAGSLESYWPDAGLAGIVFLAAVALPIALLSLFKKRADLMRSPKAGDA